MSDVSPELEAVARAIYVAEHPWVTDDTPPIDVIGNKYFTMARAALQSIREPTEGMLPHMYHGPVTDWKKTIDYILGGLSDEAH